MSESTLATNVIRDEEAARAAVFGRATALLALLSGIVGFFRHVPWSERAVIELPVVTLGLVGSFVWWRSRDARTYSRRLFRVFGVTGSICALILIYSLGVFTPIVVIVVAGLAFFLNSADRVFAATVAGLVIFAFVTLALLTMLGIVPNAGAWRIAARPQEAAMTLIVAAVMATQVFVSLSNRRALQEALIRAQEAMRVVRTREAQLDEVRENLDVALKGANEGRLTGKTLGGYRLGEIVGRGAMGEVYAAERDGQRFAVKVLRALDDDKAIAQRFVREAEIAKKVRGPNLVEFFDTGHTEADGIYIVMELLEGKDLGAILRERTSLPLDEAVALVDQCASGLGSLHGAGVIHRDLKPQNLFLSKKNAEWKILDYGVSKVVGARTMTRGDIVGTPGYMSPEQAQGQDIDTRSDVFSLAAVAYRVVAGRRPFGGTNMPQILYQVVHGALPRARELNPLLPRAVDEVLAKALSKKRDDRYATAAAFAAAFRKASDSPQSQSAIEEDLATIVNPSPSTRSSTRR